jgi:hypothetical protein
LSVWGLLTTRSLYLPLFIVICMHLSQQVCQLLKNRSNSSELIKIPY